MEDSLSCTTTVVLHIDQVSLFCQSVGDGGQGWGNVLLYIILSPKIRQRLLYDLCHPRLICRTHQDPISVVGSNESVSEHETTETVN